MERLDEVLGDLSQREAEIIRMRFGLDNGVQHTLEQIGSAFGVSGEMVRQIERRALTRLRHPVRKRRLANML